MYYLFIILYENRIPVRTKGCHIQRQNWFIFYYFSLIVYIIKGLKKPDEKANESIPTMRRSTHSKVKTTSIMRQLIGREDMKKERCMYKPWQSKNKNYFQQCS